MPEHERHDGFVDLVAEALRASVEFSPAVADRIMATVRADASSASAPYASAQHVRALPRRWAVWSMAAAAALVVAVGAGLAVRGGLLRQGDVGRMAVQFVLPATVAHDVAVVGDFNGWDVRATPLRRSDDGRVWRASVALTPGAHVYSFVVDGVRWVPDPAAPLAPGTDFGSANSLVTVAPGAT